MWLQRVCPVTLVVGFDAEQCYIFNPLNAQLSPICKPQLVEIFPGVFKFCSCFSKNLTVYTKYDTGHLS